MRESDFEWEGGHPALNFINTLDERLSLAPVERLGSFSALVSFVCQAKLIDRKTATALACHDGKRAAQRVLSDAIAFREQVHRVLRSLSAGKRPVVGQLAALNIQITDAAMHRRLRLTNQGGVRTWDKPQDVERPLWELASVVENLFLDEQYERVRKCAAADCGTFFIDLSKAGRRKWCSMANCGNRNKVRRFRGHPLR